MSLKDVNIGKKLIVFLSLLIFIFAGVSIYIVRSMSIINQNGYEVGTQWLTSIEHISAVKSGFAMYRLAEYKHLNAIDKETLNEAEAELEGIKKEIYEDLKIYASFLVPGVDVEEIKSYEYLKSKIDSYMSNSSKFLEYSRSNNSVASEKLLNGDMLKGFKEASVEISRIVIINEEGAAQRVDISANEYAESYRIAIVGVLFSILFTALSIIVLRKQIATPIQTIESYMGLLIKGELGQPVPNTDRKDEIGKMAHAIEVFRENLLQMKNMEQQQERDRQQKEVQRKKIDEATTRFSETMTNITAIVASAATELQASARSLSRAADETTTQSTSVARSSSQASENVQTVASATEELTASIGEISQQVARSANVASLAVEQANIASQKIESLSQAAEKVTEITTLISGLAEQTNLLALNATIEAARAGDAGKGFAVVASEVKNLANNSSVSADQISAQISSMQNITVDTVDAIRSVTKIIDEIGEISQSIAAAVQEQESATREISRNVSDVSSATSEVNLNISGVNQSAEQTGHAAQDLLGAADELGKQADVLKREFERYVTEIRNA